ncbi:MAG TPA: glutamyl-tRNA reductase [Blastocatellia bacterium]
MNIVLIGLSHKTAPVEMRERLAFVDSSLADALSKLVDHDTLDEGLIVSTCNRIEMVASSPADPEKGIDRLMRFLCDFHELQPAAIDNHIYRHAGVDAIRHIFRVASSLDSMVVGESQILGQVKDAYRQAVQAGTVGRMLSQLMDRALTVAKRVRSETEIAHRPVSVSSVAVELALKIFDSLAEKNILLVGAGEMSELAARNLIEEGASRIIVTNRTHERAESVARSFGGSTVPFESFYEVLSAVDIVICSTGAPACVINAAETRRALRSRRKGPVLFIDISVPRNIDPKVAQLENSFLFDIDDLESVVRANISEREAEARKAEDIIDAEAHHFVKHIRAMDIGPSVVEVKEILAQLALGEFQRNRKRMGDLSQEQETAIRDVLIPSLVNKLSHPIIVHLRTAARNGDNSQVVEELRKMIRID